MSSASEQVRALAAERPDLLPLLRRIVKDGGEGHFEDVAEEDLAELVRRGLLERSYLGPS